MRVVVRTNEAMRLVGLSESGWGEFWVSVVSMVIGVGSEGKIEQVRFGRVRVR